MSQIAEELVGESAHQTRNRVIDSASEVGLPETVDAAGFVRDRTINLVRSGILNVTGYRRAIRHEQSPSQERCCNVTTRLESILGKSAATEP